MSRLPQTLAIAIAFASALSSFKSAAQLLPDAKKAEHVKILKAPELELANDDFSIIRWTTTNPGGSDEHYGIVHYGTDPKGLSQTAKSPIVVNRGHPRTIFRVSLWDLKPGMTYYYWVTSEESNGRSDAVKSTVRKFTTPGPGERLVNVNFLPKRN